MSVLAKKERGKLDDTIPLKCFIESFVNVDNHTEFVVKVQRGANADNNWKVQHRYNDFADLHSTLTGNTVGMDLPLPPKKTFGNMDSTFLHARRVGLQEFMDELLSKEIYRSNINVMKFLDPHNYSEEIEKVAQQQAAMFFRSEPNWELQENLKDIGWRARKQFFTIKSKDGSKKSKYLLSWVEHGPDMCIDYETSLMALLRQITILQHGFIYPVVYASCTEKGSTVVRQLHPQGTLRDLINKAKPCTSCLKKYGNIRNKSGLDPTNIQRIGRQVLEALKFLKDKNWPYGHLHAGNVIVDGQKCRLLDIENGVLGLPSVYRHFMMEIKAIKDTEAMDVYCFGQLVYEMTFGTALQSSTVDQIPETCPPHIKSLLLSILGKSAAKGSLPTIEELIALSFFSEIAVQFDDKPSFKVSKVKDSLKKIKDTIETRLKEDQKKLRQFHRLSKARSELLSEEEKKKRKKSTKKKVSQSEAPLSALSDSSKDVSSSKRNSKMERSPEDPLPQQPSKAPAPSKNPPKSAPPPPKGAPPPPKDAPPPTKSAPQGAGRGALLSSISGFGKGGLKKTVTNDRSTPKL